MTWDLLKRHWLISESKRTTKVPHLWEREHYSTLDEGLVFSLLIIRSSSPNQWLANCRRSIIMCWIDGRKEGGKEGRKEGREVEEGKVGRRKEEAIRREFL